MSYVTCKRCGASAGEPPGFRLSEYEQLEAVLFSDDTVLVGPDLPQKLTCLSCGSSVAVARGSIEVRKPPKAN